ncbi:hypothetical protein O181_050765 [Austropuccinia psidii MF-1]|uniref:Uncharacterized protein n=1 Tax=Austropuccinia psidii MF-1 TaxID=1389203 RepID=A0A9Q3DVX6_9BASI|nr:hypothetical protein [Austropuccinia psidii MF-1]
MVTSLLDWSKVIIQPIKDGNGKRTFGLGPIVTTYCHPWDSNAKNKTHQIPPNKTHPFHICLPSKPHGNPLQAEVAPDEPPQHNEPPIPGPSPSSEPPEDIPTCEPEPEVALMHSTEDPFVPPRNPWVPSSPHSHNDPCQDFTDFDDSSSHCPPINQPNLVGALLLAPHDSFCGLNSSKWDAPGIEGGTKQPPLPGTGGLSKGGHYGDSLQTSRKKKNLFPVI